MSDSNQKPKKHISDPEDTRSVIDIIRGLQNGSINAKNLSILNRQACVEHLTGEGYSVVEIAEILKVSERTIARDRQAIYKANAVHRDPELVGQIVGRLMHESDLSIGHMRKVARNKTTNASVKVDADYRCYLIMSDRVQCLQRLGYLPIAAHEIRADLTHHIGDIPDVPVIQAEIERLILIAPESADGTIPQKLLELKNKAEVARIATEVEVVSSTLSEKEVSHEESE